MGEISRTAQVFESCQRAAHSSDDDEEQCENALALGKKSRTANRGTGEIANVSEFKSSKLRI